MSKILKIFSILLAGAITAQGVMWDGITYNGDSGSLPDGVPLDIDETFLSISQYIDGDGSEGFYDQINDDGYISLTDKSIGNSFATQCAPDANCSDDNNRSWCAEDWSEFKVYIPKHTKSVTIDIKATASSDFFVNYTGNPDIIDRVNPKVKSDYIVTKTNGSTWFNQDAMIGEMFEGQTIQALYKGVDTMSIPITSYQLDTFFNDGGWIYVSVVDAANAMGGISLAPDALSVDYSVQLDDNITTELREELLRKLHILENGDPAETYPGSHILLKNNTCTEQEEINIGQNINFFDLKFNSDQCADNEYYNENENPDVENDECLLLECPLGFTPKLHTCIKDINQTIWRVEPISFGMNYISFPTDITKTDLDFEMTNPMYYSNNDLKWVDLTETSLVPAYSVIKFENTKYKNFNFGIEYSPEKIYEAIDEFNALERTPGVIKREGTSINLVANMDMTENIFGYYIYTPDENNTDYPVRTILNNDILLDLAQIENKWAVDFEKETPEEYNATCINTETLAEEVSTGRCLVFTSSCVPDGWNINPKCGLTEEDTEGTPAPNANDAGNIFTIYISGTRALFINWSPIKDATSYEVYENGVLISETPNSGYSDKKPASSTELCYTVKAKSNGVTIATSTEACRLIQDGDITSTVINTPEESAYYNITNDINVTIENSVATLSWEAIDDVSSYVVYINEKPIKRLTKTEFRTNEKNLSRNCIEIKGLIGATEFWSSGNICNYTPPVEQK